MTWTELKDIDKGLSFGTNGTHRLLFNEEPKNLADSSDLTLRNVTFRGLQNFILARKEEILFRKTETHIQADLRNSRITLVMGEHGGRKLLGDVDRTPFTQVHAKADRHEDFETVLEYLGLSHPSAHDLAMDLRTKPYLFENDVEWMRVVGALRSTNMKVQQIRKETSDDLGMREKRMNVEVTEGKLDLSWNFFVPIFQGEGRRLISVRAIYEVQPDWSVDVVLISNNVVAQERHELEGMMAKAITDIEVTLGTDVIPVVYVDNPAANNS